MSEEEFEQEQQYVEILGEDGDVVKCEVYDVVDFEDRTYALLLPLDEDENNEDSELIVMEYIEEGDECYFQNIDDEEQFNRVCEYIQTLDVEEDDEEE